jgi:hypothetical protein
MTKEIFKFNIGDEVFARDGDDVLSGKVTQRYYSEKMVEEKLETQARYLVFNLTHLDGEYSYNDWTYDEEELSEAADTVAEAIETESNEKIAKMKKDLADRKKK